MSKYEQNKEKNYDDILHLPHPVSRKRPQMPLEDRAAQFSPFAAVVGHEASVKEAARVTDAKRDLDEAQKIIINEQLREIDGRVRAEIQTASQTQAQGCTESGIEVEIEHFEADALKSGGHYVVSRGSVKKIDGYTHRVYMSDGAVIAIDDIFRLVIL